MTALSNIGRVLGLSLVLGFSIWAAAPGCHFSQFGQGSVRLSTQDR